MDLQAILADVGEEKAAVIMAAIEDEKKRGVAESRRKGEDVKKHITEIAKLKDALRDTLGVEISGDADLRELLAGKVETLKSGMVPDSEVKKMAKQLDAITRSFTEAQAREEQTRAKLTTAKISNALAQKMSGKFHGHDLAIEKLISSGRVKINDADQVVFVQDDLEIDVDKGIETFRKERPDLVINKQSAGAGGTQGTHSKDTKFMSLSAFNQLDSKAMAAYMESGGKISDN
jgi:hypothetical protein